MIARSMNDSAVADAPGLHLARRFWYAMRRWWWTAYWRLDVRGLENVPQDGPVLLCANHTSHLDALAILAALPGRVALRAGTAAAKDVFGDHRLRDLLSRIMTNAVPIQRGSEFARGLRRLEAVLEDGRPLILFPEGRRSADGELVEFKCGAAMLAVHTGAPIIPIHIHGAHDSLPRGAVIPTAADITVHFGAPIKPEEYRRAIDERRLDKREAYERMTNRLKCEIARMMRQDGPHRAHRSTRPEEIRAAVNVQGN